MDKERGATKDPVDCLRYLVQEDQLTVKPDKSRDDPRRIVLMTEELPKFLSTGQVMNLTGLSRYDIDCLVKSGRLRRASYRQR